MGVSPLLASILKERNEDIDSARHFLAGAQEPLANPFLLPDMEKAVERLLLALERKEKIVVFGDYDVDGMTATSVLTRVLRRCGADVSYYLPNRLKEGYGLHAQNVEHVAAKASLLITVDCGIRSLVEVEMATKLGLDVIITDHHRPGSELPKALAVVNPRRPENRFPDTEIAGVGISFELCRALWQRLYKKPFLDDIDIVAIGTVADVVSLRGENRKFVQLGLAQIENIGLKQLIKVCKLENKKITASQVGFVIGPRLNAAGRLGDPNDGVRLLLSDDQEEAAQIAGRLDEQNRRRQEIVEEAFEQALKLLEGDAAPQHVVVVGAPHWHEGIIGIVASRLCEHFYLPVVVLSIEGERAKGSCRSIAGFDICAALEANREYLDVFGGHSQAAGLSLSIQNIKGFKRALEAYAKDHLTKELMTPKLKISAILKSADLNEALPQELERLEPYGMGNPAPRFLCAAARVESATAFGRENKHLRLSLAVESMARKAIFWQQGEIAPQLAGQTFDFVFAPQIETWQQKSYFQMIIGDYQKSCVKGSYPAHADLGSFYLALKKNAGADGYIEEDVLMRLKKEQGLAEEMFSRCVKIFEEVELLRKDEKKIALLPASSKKDLNDSATFRERYFEQ